MLNNKLINYTLIINSLMMTVGFNPQCLKHALIKIESKQGQNRVKIDITDNVHSEI